MIVYKKGNIFDFIYDGKYDIVLQGCNCFCKMDDGIALQFANKFPEVLLADLKTIPKDRSKLGTFLSIDVERYDKKFTILNCYTQYDFGGYDIEKLDFFEYESFETILKELSQYSKKIRFGMPLMGGGRASGDTERILSLIEKYMCRHNVEIILFNTQSLPKQFMSIKNQIIIGYHDTKDYIKKYID